MLDPDSPLGGQPLIAFRRELDPRKEGCGRLPNEKPFPASPARLDSALLKAWSAYGLWRAGDLVPCGRRPGMPAQNVMPPGFCQATGPASLPPCPSPPTGSRAFVQWLQASLNRVLDAGLPVNGIFDARTRSALRSFQQRKGLMPGARVDGATQAALALDGGLSVPCQTQGSTSASSSKWSESMLSIFLMRRKPDCQGWATPKSYTRKLVTA
jgi:peptidoglycan hydrolase-like protein with peptidoglycan-binding domain